MQTSPEGEGKCVETTTEKGVRGAIDCKVTVDFNVSTDYHSPSTETFQKIGTTQRDRGREEGTRTDQ